MLELVGNGRPATGDLCRTTSLVLFARVAIRGSRREMALDLLQMRGLTRIH